MKKELRRWTCLICSLVMCFGLFLACPVTANAAGNSRQAYSSVFDATYYYNTYADVAAACGNNPTKLLDHYIKNGCKEGRNASAEFNAVAYRNRYSDLNAAYGDDWASYHSHYAQIGKAEGRSALPDASGTSSASPVVNKQGIIGTYTTKYQDNIPRAVNVRVASSRINGVVVKPGESFSFTNTILPRTPENGYVVAPIFVSGTVSEGVGGGVCQVSSTLYAAMLTAGLPATERHEHSLPVTYLPKGMDATIAGTYLDLKFTNIYNKPLLITSVADSGTLTVTLSLQ